MVEEDNSLEPAALPGTVGAKLRAAREARGLSLAQVAAETRITQRHLELIEAGDFARLPARAYAVGFSRSYAKLLEMDDEEIAREVRAEISMIEPDDSDRARKFEPGDPARVPSAKLAWLAACGGIAIFAVGCYFLWNSFFAPAGTLPWLTAEQEQAAAPSAQAAAGPTPAVPAAPDPKAPVVFTSLEDGIWVKFYDQDGRQLMQKQMAKGETYTVPADVEGPQLWTGRPDALAITVGGKPIPKLGENDRIMKDVPVTAAALLARGSVDASAAVPADGPASPTG